MAGRARFAAILVMMLLAVALNLCSEADAFIAWSLLLSPAILLVPLLFLLNAQAALLDSYAFERRSLGTPRVAAPRVATSKPVSSTPPVTPVPAPSPSPPAPSKKPPARSHAVSVTHIDLYDAPEQYEGKMVSLVGMTYRAVPNRLKSCHHHARAGNLTVGFYMAGAATPTSPR